MEQPSTTLRITAGQKLFQNGRQFMYEKDELIIRSGDTPSGIYYIVSGWVSCHTICADGEPNIIFTLYPGDIFPLAWASTGILRDVNFAALETSELLRISRDEFLTGMETNPDITKEAMTMMAKTIYGFSRELENLQYHSARERVCYRLMMLANHFGAPVENGIKIDKAVTNEYIARSTNMTRETASREMSRLNKLRIIKTSNNRIIITDLERFKHELDTGLVLGV